MCNEFMRTSHVKGYEKFAKMASNGWNPLDKMLNVRKDLMSIILTHSEAGFDGVSRCKTLGKMIAEKGDIEGRFIMMLHTRFVESEYVFQTQMDETHMARSPMGMFNKRFIPNDLQLVINSIKSYYEDEEQAA